MLKELQSVDLSSVVFDPVRPLDDMAQNILQKRYYHVGESSWNDVVSRVTNWVVKDDLWWKSVIHDMMLHRYFIPNSPCLVNSGKQNGGLSACFVVGFEDSIEEIYKTKLEFALIAKKGGGCGTTLSNLRPENDTVAGSAHGYAGGPVKFFETICYDMKALTQAGFREMAMMGVMYYKHPDIMKFIRAKVEEGRMHTTNISVAVDSEFMELVKSDGTYWTEFGGKKYQKIRARDVFKAIVDGAWGNGEPGMVFIDRMNENSPYKYSGQKIEATNPCFTGDMLLLTENGYRPFGDMDGETVNIVNSSGCVSSGLVWKSGKKETVSIRLSNGDVIKSTPDHVFSTTDGDVKAIDLKGRHLVPFLQRKEMSSDMVAFGYAQGDGNLTRLSSQSHKGIEVNIGAKDQELLPLFEKYGFEKHGDRVIYVSGIKDSLLELGFSAKTLPERVMPSTYPEWSVSDKEEFLRGMYSANGTCNNFGRICYKTTSKRLADELVETLKIDFEISSYITTNKSHPIQFSNGVYTVKESYDVNISAFNSRVKFFNSIGFVQSYKTEKLAETILSISPSVKTIRENGVEEVYDFSEPETHWGVVNGYVVHNCGEEPLPKNGVCNLGSLDLSKFLSNGEIDWNKLETAVRVSVRFLDAVIDASSFPTERIRQWVSSNRPVGLGVMGVADLLLDLGITYGGRESVEVLGTVMQFIQTVSESESVVMGQELGIPESCRHLPTPRRNITVQSIAPTGTISLIAGCSNGIEPIFSEFAMRTDKTGTYKMVHPKSHEPHFRCAVTGNGGTEVTWQEHLRMQNEAQKYVDSGVSKTINFPNAATKQDVADAFMTAYDLGDIKGMTIYRNGSRTQEVLSPKVINKEKKCPDCGGSLVKEGGCTHCDSCEYSFCEIS